MCSLFSKYHEICFENVLVKCYVYNNLFIYLIGKSKRKFYKLRKKKHPKAHPKYTGSIQQVPKGKKQQKIRGNTKHLTCPHLESNKSKKPIKDKGSSSIYNLVQDQKLHTK